MLELDMGLLQAGAGVKGEFENRLKARHRARSRARRSRSSCSSTRRTRSSARAASSGGDAANILKPALARGELRTIAATTWSEYKKYFEKDAAFARALPAGEGRRADRAGGRRHAPRPARRPSRRPTT